MASLIDLVFSDKSSLKQKKGLNGKNEKMKMNDEVKSKAMSILYKQKGNSGSQNLRSNSSGNNNNNNSGDNKNEMKVKGNSLKNEKNENNFQKNEKIAKIEKNEKFSEHSRQLTNTIQNKIHEKYLNQLKNFDSFENYLQNLKDNQEIYQKLYPAKDEFASYNNNNINNSIFPKVTEERKNSFNNTNKYKPQSTEEKNQFDLIDSVNQKIKMTANEIRLGSKRERGSKTTTKPRYVHANKTREDDVWCAKCRGFHDKDLHWKKPEQVILNTSRFASLSSSSAGSGAIVGSKSVHKGREVGVGDSKSRGILNEIDRKNSFEGKSRVSASGENNKLVRSINTENKYNKDKISKFLKSVNKPTSTIKQPDTQRLIKEKIAASSTSSSFRYTNTERTSIPNIKPTSRPTQPPSLPKKPINPNLPNRNPPTKNAIFSQDDFIDDTDDPYLENPNTYRQYLNQINKRFCRNHSSSKNYDYSLDDESDMEADFDEIQEEEDYTAKVGEYEDQMELERENKLNKKLKKQK